MPEKRANTLYAFYDLELSPIAFDFTVFAVNAELARRNMGCNSIHFVIVPGDAEGFRSDDAAYDANNKRWRLTHIVVPLCNFLPSPSTATICPSREAAEQLLGSADAVVFPEGYSVETPVARFSWSHLIAAATCGEVIPSLVAPPQAVDYMRRWLASIADGRKAIAITLRESTHNPQRNSNIDAWIEFARSLDPDEYVPIFIRDTEKCFGPDDGRFADFLMCPLAATNLDLRIALYELSYLNLMVMNGPGELCRLDDRIRYLMFKLTVEEVDNASPIYMASQGFQIGGQLPHASAFQRQVWEDDETDVIRREFETMSTLLRDTLHDDTAPHPTSASAEDPMEVAVRLQFTGRIEEAATIYQRIVAEAPDRADAWHMLGIIAQQTAQSEIAEKLLMRAIGINPGQANYYVSLSDLLAATGRDQEATLALRTAIEIAPEDADAHARLARALHQSGEQVAAENAMMQALQLEPGTVRLYEQAAKMLEANGNSAEALNFYRRAVELREEIETTAREAQSHLVEIPRITLSQG